ncbi:nucleotidyltransferase family protein [Thalassomonas viridans]|uniref:Nucleotidyltransferase family protein n=1 Tax=Thalassomonas viridans TaxID=137584 RepID=A0AAE9Z8D1_9GAMM|nr:nucleotidyltransferase family protein [Thalassomonas viridans]WDE07909.1 nucleotidyltransferase family protein [Thalassomonas viridans]
MPRNIPGIKDVADTLFQWLANWCTRGHACAPEAANFWNEREWDIARAVIIIHGMGPLWGYLLSQQQDKKLFPQSLYRFLMQQYQENSIRLALMDKEKKRILKAFRQREIQIMPFKGIELACHLYPDNGSRPMADIDLYVLPEQRAEVCRLIEQLGYKIHAANQCGITCYPQHWQNEEADLAREINWHGAQIETQNKTLLMMGESSRLPFSLDIHFSMHQGTRETRFNLDKVFRKACLHSGALSPEEALVFQLLHATKHLRSHSGRWIQLYDIYLLLKHTTISWDKVFAITDKERLSPQLLLPLILTRKLFGHNVQALEQRLAAQTPLHLRLLFNRLSLCELSCCNPYLMPVWRSLFWTHNIRHLSQWLTLSLKADKETTLLADGQATALAPFSKRFIRALKKFITKTTRPQWQIFALQDLRPGRDWN